MKREVAVSLDELRDVARGLHPAVLSGHGLAVALESLAARAPVPVGSRSTAGRLPDAVEVAAYYVVWRAWPTSEARQARRPRSTSRSRRRLSW